VVDEDGINSISKEISMELNRLLKAGFGRRGFLSGSSLLLAGSLLGTSDEVSARPAHSALLPEPIPQDKQ
jgi:hypothetical protein